jgi:REP-associated tyrosine transposase
MTSHAPFQHLESAYQLHFYLCFKTHYARPLFAEPAVQTTINNVVEDVCNRHGYHLLDTRVSPDHLRLLLSLKPDQTVSRAVQMVKGNLSRQVPLAYPALMERHRTRTLWAEGYFARSSGKADIRTVRDYVEAQPVHHGYRGAWTSALSYSNPRFRSPAFHFAHCVCILDYHVVLATKFRQPVFDEHIAPGLFDYVVAIGNKRGFPLDRIGLAPDHLHLIIEARPDVSVESCALSLVNNTRQWMEKRYGGRAEGNGVLGRVAAFVLCRYGWRVFHCTDQTVPGSKLMLHRLKHGGVLDGADCR